MDSSLRNRIYYYALFLIWPFSMLYFTIRHFREPIGRILFILIFSYLGFTTDSLGDLLEYEFMFYQNKDLSIIESIAPIIYLNKGDIYIEILSVFVGLFFESHHFFFAFIFAIYAFFFTGIIFEISKLLPPQLTKFGLFFFICFALFFSIQRVMSVRFYTGATFYLYMMLNYIVYKKNKFIFLSLLAPFFHFALSLITLVSIIFIFLKDKLFLSFIILVISFFINQNTVVGFLESQSQGLEETFYDSKVKGYASDEGRTALEDRYLNRYLNFNIKAKLFEDISILLRYLLIIGIFIAYVQKNVFQNHRLLRQLFSLLLLLFALANITNNISNGDRFITLYLFLALGFFLFLINEVKISNSLYKYLVLLSPILLLYGIMSLYASNPLFSTKFFLFNYFSSYFSIQY